MPMTDIDEVIARLDRHDQEAAQVIRALTKPLSGDERDWLEQYLDSPETCAPPVGVIRKLAALAIDTRRAETRSGSVHESAGPQDKAQGDLA